MAHEARALGPITGSGTAAAGQPAKIFNVAAATGNAITANLTWSGNADLQLSLKNPSGAVVATGYSTPKVQPEKIIHKALATGTYKLVVTSKVGSSAFTLSGSVDAGLPASFSDPRTGSVSKTGTTFMIHEFSVPAVPAQLAISVGWPTTSANLNLQLKKGTATMQSANTNNNPEVINFTAQSVGTWKLQVTAAAGASSYEASINVSMGNGPPNAVDDTAATQKNTALASIPVLTNDTDPNGNPLHVQAVTQGNEGGIVAINTGATTVSYDPPNGFDGTETFTYTACDNAATALCDTATVTVRVRGNNAAPSAVDDTASASTAVATNIVVLGNDSDADGDPLHLGTITPSANATVTPNANGSVTYTSDAGFDGTDTFTYEACDNWAPQECDTATVTVTVTTPPVGSPTEFKGYYFWSGGIVNSGSAIANQMANDIVDGLSVVQSWAKVETSDNVYDWRVFDSWIAQGARVRQAAHHPFLRRR